MRSRASLSAKVFCSRKRSALESTFSPMAFSESPDPSRRSLSSQASYRTRMTFAWFPGLKSQRLPRTTIQVKSSATLTSPSGTRRACGSTAGRNWRG